MPLYRSMAGRECLPAVHGLMWTFDWYLGVLNAGIAMERLLFVRGGE